MGDTLDNRISDLLERGLQLYGIGEARQALEIWTQVLTLDPTNLRAHEYIRFVGEGMTQPAPSDPSPSPPSTPAAPVAPAPVALVEPAVVAAELPELIAAAPEPIAAAPEPIAAAPEPIAAAPTPIAPAESEPAPPIEAPEVVVGAIDPALEFSWGELVGAANISSGQVAPLEPPPEPAPSSAPAGPFDLPPTQPPPAEAHSIETPVPTPSPQIPMPPAAASPAPVSASNPMGDWGSAFEISAASGGMQAAGELLTSPPAAPVAAASGWDSDPSAQPPVALVGRGYGDDEYLVPITGENKLGRVERRPTPEQPTAELPRPPLDPRAMASECESLMQGARELFALGNFSESLELVEKVLALDAENREARDYVERNQETLLKMYESKIGSFQRMPRVLIPPDEVIWLNLHHRAGFLLSQIDGAMTYEDLLALSAMSKIETCKILVQLLAEGVITSS